MIFLRCFNGKSPIIDSILQQLRSWTNRASAIMSQALRSVQTDDECDTVAVDADLERLIRICNTTVNVAPMPPLSNDPLMIEEFEKQFDATLRPHGYPAPRVGIEEASPEPDLSSDLETERLLAKDVQDERDDEEGVEKTTSVEHDEDEDEDEDDDQEAEEEGGGEKRARMMITRGQRTLTTANSSSSGRTSQTRETARWRQREPSSKSSKSLIILIQSGSSSRLRRGNENSIPSTSWRECRPMTWGHRRLMT
ncbi:hypothetical protein EJ03DRAFT_101789 [Teratosphaeria nubilosa]|uniref:Uncharacterized protein n=1 Tax=Teratosphaeria nubilosa TaxID=161662 RepID=A0A6G1LLZ5_9PEZI|nr:hypothetical protein EJ03DRAFT_101789 [Teratosphaeria nubilosa]